MAASAQKRLSLTSRFALSGRRKWQSFIFVLETNDLLAVNAENATPCLLKIHGKYERAPSITAQVFQVNVCVSWTCLLCIMQVVLALRLEISPAGLCALTLCWERYTVRL